MTNLVHDGNVINSICQGKITMMHKNKWLTKKEAYSMALRVARAKRISIQEVAKLLRISHTTIYRWNTAQVSQPDVRITEALKELAVKEGITKH